jgi:hypothetical protein
MKRKMTILLFSLLLAVGWTSDAQAQEVTRSKSTKYTTSQLRKTLSQKEAIGQPGVNATTVTLMNQGSQFRAPLRSQNFSQTSPVVHPKSWYQALPDVTWNGGSQNITEPFTDIDGMMALVKRVYTDTNIPGFKFSEPLNMDIPYQSIQHGWNIIYNQYEDIELFFGSGYIDIAAIRIVSGTDTTIWAPTSTTSSLPNGWTTDGNLYFESMSSYGYNGLYAAYLASGGSIYIPASQLANSNGYVSVDVASIFVGPSNVTNFNYTVQVIANDTYPYVLDSIRSDNLYWYTKFNCAGTTTPPDDAGYTVMLVKVQDDFDQNSVPEYTYSTQELRNYFQTYVKEIQLLTDGLRVQEGTDEAGTLFAYNGDLNKFYFIGKGKMAFKHSIESDPFDRAPFYSMYEEFSPYVSGEHEDHSDFYEKMMQGTTYPVVHDCEGVICLDHYFAMTGQEGSSENRVNCLVFYVPDNRGQYGGWQTYEPEHQPTVGMYMIDLYANIASSTTPNYYTTTVTWEDNLDVVTHSDGIPQTYYLYEIWDKDGDGDMDTTCVYTGPNTYWSSADDPVHGDFLVGDPTAYDVHYFVIGVPTAATNPDTFYAQSNTDDVTVPGKNDFIGLQWVRYESDYFAKNVADPNNNEVNYYRNWLAPHKLSTEGQGGISAGNVGANGRTLTLYREDTPIIDLELVMNGNKAYYRIKYRDRATNQQVEPGYNENTGEKNNN